MTYEVGEPFDGGLLDVGDGHRVWWETAGNPDGTPAVILHGGPGSGTVPGMRRVFDPDRYLVVSFDQRQCGRSTPSASDPRVDLSANTTQHLVADIEALRHHLGIERWLLWGGSWGASLALVYAEAHPEAVSAIVIASVTAGTADEIEWITRSMGRVFPEAWERFVSVLPPGARGGNLPAAFNHLLLDPDPAVHGPAAAAWCEWEDTHVATVPGHTPWDRYDDPAFRLQFARIVTHYWGNDCFLEPDQIMRDIDRIGHIPGAMVHGRLDISGPAITPWRIARAWPAATLEIVEAEGHGGGGSMTDRVVAAVDRFADLR